MPAVTPQECAPPLVLALDLGTSSARAILYDGRGRKLEGMVSRTAYTMSTTAEGGVEIEADYLVEITSETIDRLLARFASFDDGSPRFKIAAVAVSTFWHGLVGVDSSGRAITPLYSWNDTRAEAAARELRGQINERDLQARTGCLLHASYWPAKLAWLRATLPRLFNRVARWMSIGDYFYLRLFGESFSSISMASATGLFNQNRSGWDSEILSALNIPAEALSPLVDIEAVASSLSARLRSRWPSLAGAGWFPALGDGACDNIGSGSVTRDRAALMIGTSGALRALWQAEAVNIPEGLWCYRADRKRFVMGGALSNGGDLFAWMRQTLRLGAIEEVESELAAMEADAHGLTVLPFLSGERSTGWAASARAAITGLSLNTRSAEILRAGLEAVAYRFAAIYELLAKELGEPRELIGSGAGLLRSPAWAQIISDVIGKQVIASAEEDASSRGAALLVLEALGAIPAIENVEVEQGRVYSPGSERHARYLEARERQASLYEALIGRAARS